MSAIAKIEVAWLSETLRDIPFRSAVNCTAMLGLPLGMGEMPDI